VQTGALSLIRDLNQFTVTLTGNEGIPFTTTCSELAPVSVLAGTSKLVETGFDPVATATSLKFRPDARFGLASGYQDPRVIRFQAKFIF